MRKILIGVLLSALELGAQIDLGVSGAYNQLKAGWISGIGDITDASGFGAEIEVYHRSLIENYPIYVGLEFGYDQSKLEDEDIESKAMSFGIGSEYDLSNLFSATSITPFIGISLGYATWEVSKGDVTEKPGGPYVGGDLGLYYQFPTDFPLSLKVAVRARRTFAKETDKYSNFSIGKLSLGLLTIISQ